MPRYGRLVRPHLSLAYLTPWEFVTRWKNKRRKANLPNLLDEYT